MVQMRSTHQRTRGRRKQEIVVAVAVRIGFSMIKVAMSMRNLRVAATRKEKMRRLEKITVVRKVVGTKISDFPF